MRVVIWSKEKLAAGFRRVSETGISQLLVDMLIGVKCWTQQRRMIDA
jgi:hypothetical protein